MFNSNVKMWAKFWSKSDSGLISIVFTPVLGWDKTNDGEYTAIVLCPVGIGISEYAVAANDYTLQSHLGHIDSMILDESIKETIEKV